MRAKIGENEDMPLLRHLEELRKRLFHSIVACVLGLVVAYPLSSIIFDALREPLWWAGEKSGRFFELIFTGPLEVFVSFLKISFVVGAMLVLPYLFYQLWAFISPGLSKDERKWVLPFVLLGTLFFFGGVFFAYTFVLPYGYLFFIEFSPEYIQASIRVTEYLSLTLKLLFAFGLIFDLPVLLLILMIAGLVSSKTLATNWRLVITLNFVAAALLTPADPITMVLMALPLTVLFFLTVLIGRIFEKKISS